VNDRNQLPPSPPPLLVRVDANADQRTLTFRQSFRIGRTDESELCIKNEYVSRAHASINFENGQWCVRDLGSSNGIFVDGKRVESAAVAQALTFRLGIAGPIVALEVEKPKPEPPKIDPPKVEPPKVTQPKVVQPPSATMVHRIEERYFTKTAGNQPVGEHTMMVQLAFQQVQKKQKLQYGKIMAGLVVLVLAAGAYAFYEHQQVRQQKAMAENLFYTMKSLDVDIANIQGLVMNTQSAQGLAEIRKYRSRRKEMERSYDQFLSTLRVYNPKMTEQDRLLLRVARIFGECEIDMPPGFVTEVQNYIKKWQSSARLRNAIRTAKEKGYTSTIAQELLAQGLPPQFFYLALQESDFDPYISGPMTRLGIAKGMWQFIPQTAEKYGLHVGPLADLRRPDPGDDRHHWDRATKAAAHYLKDIYSTDAQASGLLVMASYNWGEDRVVPLIRSMPANPRDRNFWSLLAKYGNKVPDETYGYVYYIFSAAVIGENPRLFGFDFDNPLADLDNP
jgi:pSer/pThr/pTyr-binding forkhead associated (FHA) protein